MCITCYYEVSLRCLARFRGFSPDVYLKVVQLCQSSSPIIRNFDQGANGMYIYILTLFFVSEEILANDADPALIRRSRVLCAWADSLGLFFACTL